MNELNLQKSISKSDIQNISNELLNIYKSIYQDVLNITYLKDYLNSNDRIVIDETLSVMKNEFDLITEKLSDTRLYVGVTGEFSSGKSTFLNALLEHDVLETDVIQGTTCAPTIIEYSKNPNVLVKFSDGTEVSLTDKDYLTKLNTLLYEKLNKLRLGFVSRLFYKSSVLSDEVVKKYITTFAASEDVSKNVTSVTWSYPLDVLSDGLVVIDTPGIGTSANKRHTEVAEAVSKNCDALIVLFDLNKPLSSELIDNVKTVTNGDPSNCIFIGTKADTIRKREIDRLISYCQNKLNKSLNKDVNFFAISPYAANEERIKSASSKSDNEYGLSQFQEFRHKLLQILLRNRGIIQSKKLNKQITSFVTKMQSMLKNDVRHFQDQISEYNKNIIPTNSPQWEQWHRQAEFDFKSYSKEIRLSMEAGVNELVGKLKKDLYDSIDSCSDHEGLKKFLENGVQQTVSGYESKFSDYINSKVYVPLNKSADDILSKLDKEYKHHLKKIENIFDFVSGSVMGNINQRDDKGALISCSSDTKSLSESFEREENSKINRGIATGLAVSLVIPGAGWIAAGVLVLVGGVLGAMFGPSLQEKKSKSKANIDEYMQRINSGFSQKIRELYDEYQKEVSTRLDRSLKLKRERYIVLINSYNAKIQKVQNNFQFAKECIDKTVVLLNNHLNEINEVIRKLE